MGAQAVVTGMENTLNEVPHALLTSNIFRQSNDDTVKTVAHTGHKRNAQMGGQF